MRPRSEYTLCIARVDAGYEVRFASFPRAWKGADMAKTIILNASPTWAGVKDDYVLRYDGHVIGRIRSAEKTWEWHLTIPMAMPEWAQGSAANLEQAKRAFAAAWGRLLNETAPERLARAWELERAAEARRQRLEAAAKNDA
jgi:hypothetical protein